MDCDYQVPLVPRTPGGGDALSLPWRQSSCDHQVTFPLLLLLSLPGQQFSLQWVYNVLEHKKEVERIIFEDPDPK